jgi:hypothetical protein
LLKPIRTNTVWPGAALTVADQVVPPSTENTAAVDGVAPAGPAEPHHDAVASAISNRSRH